MCEGKKATTTHTIVNLRAVNALSERKEKKKEATIPAKQLDLMTMLYILFDEQEL